MDILSASAKWEDWVGDNHKIHEDDFHDSGNGSSPEESLTSRNIELQLQPVSKCRIRMYHHVPEFDRVCLVKCSMCGKSIRAQFFALHCAKRHGLEMATEDERPVSCLTEPLKNASLDNVLSFIPSPTIFRDEPLENGICNEETPVPVVVQFSSDHEASNISSATEEQNFVNDLAAENLEERRSPAPNDDERHAFLINSLSEDINRNNYLKPQLTPNTLEQLNILPAGASMFNDDLEQEVKQADESFYLSTDVTSQVLPELQDQPHASPTFQIKPESFDLPDMSMNVENPFQIKTESSEDFLPEDLRNIVIKKDFDCPEMSKLLESDLNFGEKFDKNSLLSEIFVHEQTQAKPFKQEGPNVQFTEANEQAITTKKPKASKKSPRRRSQVFDPDRHCGVNFIKNGEQVQCMRAITCKAHSLALRKEVPGRSKPFLVLIQNLTAEKHALKLEKERELAALNGGMIPEAPQPVPLPTVSVPIRMMNHELMPSQKRKQTEDNLFTPRESMFPVLSTPHSGVETVGAFVGNATAATDDANVHFKVAAEEVGLLSNNENKQEDSNASLSLINPLYDARRVAGTSVLAFNKGARRLRNMFTSLLGPKGKHSPCKHNTEYGVSGDVGANGISRPGNQVLGAFPNFMNQQRNVNVGGIVPILKPRIDKVPTSAIMKQQTQSPMTFRANVADESQQKVGHFKGISASKVPCSSHSVLKDSSTPNSSLVEQSMSSNNVAAAACPRFPVPCYQSSPMSAQPTELPQSVQNSPSDGSRSKTGSNRKRKLQVHGQANVSSHSAISPIGAKVAVLSADQNFLTNSPVVQSPQSHHQQAMAHQQTLGLASPVEFSPSTPAMMQQQPSQAMEATWASQLQSPGGYPPTPSPQMPSSPVKHPYAVVHHLGMQQQHLGVRHSSPVPHSPSGVVVPRYMSPPTHNNNIVALKGSPQYRFPMHHQNSSCNDLIYPGEENPHQTQGLQNQIDMGGSSGPASIMQAATEHHAESTIGYGSAVNAISPSKAISVITPQANLTPSQPGHADPNLPAPEPPVQHSPSLSSHRQMSHLSLSPGQAATRMYGNPTEAQLVTQQMQISGGVINHNPNYAPTAAKVMRPPSIHRLVNPSGMKGMPAGPMGYVMGSNRMTTRFVYPNQAPYQQHHVAQLHQTGMVGRSVQGAKMYAIRGAPGHMMSPAMAQQYRAAMVANHSQHGTTGSPGMGTNSRVMSPMGPNMYIRGQQQQHQNWVAHAGANYQPVPMYHHRSPPAHHIQQPGAKQQQGSVYVSNHHQQQSNNSNRTATDYTYGTQNSSQTIPLSSAQMNFSQGFQSGMDTSTPMHFSQFSYGNMHPLPKDTILIE